MPPACGLNAALQAPRRVRTAIVVPALESAHTVGATLDAAIPQAPVYVVDNASSDETADLARAKGARVLTVHARSAAVVRNRGWAAAVADGAEAVLFTDADAVPSPDWAHASPTAFRKATRTWSAGAFARRRRPRSAARTIACTARSTIDCSRGPLRALRRVDPGRVVRGTSIFSFVRRRRERASSSSPTRSSRAHPATVRAVVRQEVRHGRGRARLLSRHPDTADKSRVRSWPAWIADATLWAPWHWEHARRAAGFDPAGDDAPPPPHGGWELGIP
jgi:glycosyltransferase involved in cell wall biosynthesis